MPNATEPTWETIKTFFTDRDAACMTPRGFALAKFSAVKAKAERIFDAVSTGRMPPGRRWPDDRVQTFRRWIDAGCPEGVPPPLSWSPTAAPLGTEFGARYDDICFLDPDRGWAVNSSGQIMHTANGGATWEVQFQTPIIDGFPIYLRCIRFADENTGWAGTVSEAARLFATTDGGSSWTSIELPPLAPPKICGLSVVDDSVIYASGTNDPFDAAAMMKTTDGGRSWTAWSMAAHAAALIDVLFFDANHGFVVGGRADVPNPGRDDVTPVVLETTDGGETWVDRVADLDLPRGEWGWKLQFVDARIGFVSLENLDAGAILKTVDGGRNWERLPINDPQTNKNLEGIGFLDANLGWVGGWGDRGFETGVTSRTQDGGRTWQDANEVGRFINRFWFFEGRSDVAYASGLGVYKWGAEEQPGEAAIKAAAEAPAGVALLDSTEPTSTVDEMRFDYTVPAGAHEAWLHVWDHFAGPVRTVLHEVDPESGRRSQTWDGHNDAGDPVPDGAYIYRLTIDSAVESGIVYLRKTP
ncbi:MAG: YCF48-related protein [Candidatus Nanopelagicales bacterium]